MNRSSSSCYNFIRLMPAVILGFACLAGCSVAPEEETAEEVQDTGIQPVPFPPGPDFPVARDVVDGWVSDQDTAAMFLHAWNIWKGLMQPTDEPDPGGNRNLVVFETWLSDVEIFDENVSSAADVKSRRLRPFQPPRQNHHANLAAAATPSDPEQVIAFVKYDPTAADFTFANAYNKAATLDQLQASWTPETPILDREIQQFPDPSIALKPTYWLIKQSGLTSLPVWPGPPATPMSFPPTAWDTCVLVDPSNQSGGGAAEGDCNGATKELPVVNLEDFHHQQLTEQEAQAIRELANTADQLKGAQAGDYAALVAMHVTSKELLRWTWQTFWWSASPDSPNFPSSGEAAAQRPGDLPGAAGHYAVCTAYSMVLPAQPVTGGQNLCESSGDPGCLFCYNPYLEAGFGNFSTPDNPKFGINTNCMSCHGRAHWPSSAQQPGYVGDQYDDLGGEAFAEVTKLDFLWSLQNAR